jgi:predicted ATPase/class 3 adenylate cyclase
VRDESGRSLKNMRSDLPSGTVTFVFTDVEGSTRLLHELGAEEYAEALAEHRRVIREACASEGGVEVDTQGDAFFFAFPTAPGALAAASGFTEALSSGPIVVRVGLHTGTPLLTAEGYVGGDVHRAARIAACGYGGQVLVSSSTAQLVELDLTDLGEHRLKDLSAPERIYQLGDGDFAALKSLYRTNLPIPATPFLGREQELSEVVELLSAEDARLLTLTGPGGTGKTRLALQAAAEASEAYPDGVWWVPLAPLRDPELVLATAGLLLGSKNGLAEHIQDKAMLCLFDNFEQVVEAGPELAALVGACPNLDVLVTSRERLRVSGEQTYPVPPLAESDGEALFVMRARAVDPDFVATEAVRELCLRLDELPLALELAAARTALFSPEQLLAKLSQRLDLLKGERDADPRQQTLRATIEWSYELLAEDEQRLFARLAVFAGGCTYEAAEEIARADPDTLQSLLDKSLLRKRDSKVGPRYWMLETIREYAAEKLEESGEADELQRRHAAYFLDLAESLPRDVSVSRGWLDEMEAEHDNLRAALDRLDAAAETQLVLQLAGALWRFWGVRGPHAEGMGRVDEALASDESATAARASALIAAAALAVDVKEYERGRQHADEALTLYRELDDAWGIARATFFQGYVAIESGDFAQAQPLFENSLERFSALGAEHDVQLVLFNLSWACGELGDDDRARELENECVRRARASGLPREVAFGLDLQSSRARDDGRLDVALDAALESLRIRLDEGDVQHQLDGLSRVAGIHAWGHRMEAAARLLSSSLHLHEEAGMSVPLYQEERNAKTLALIRGTLADDSFDAAWEEGSKLNLDEAVALALGEPEPDA